MASNDCEPNTKKQGSPAKKLSVRLFLLDPDHEITKITKGTCSKQAIQQLMQNGYGPPQPGNEQMHRKWRIVKGGGGHNPISHQKFFQNPSPSWIFIKNPSRSYQNPSE